MAEGTGAWALIVHGGAKEIADDDKEENRSGCLDALGAGRAVLEHGGTAVDAVEAAVRVLESLPVFNAGIGSAANEAGEIEMCAGIMDGCDLSAGAVAALKRARHPITVARRLLAEDAVLLAGEGALRFAIRTGAEVADEPSEPRERRSKAKDTVGAVAIDSGGSLAAATSTGGLEGAAVGRVGDSPLPGVGFYADNDRGAVALSGDGESIMRLTVAARAMERIEEDGPEQALRGALISLPRFGGDGGGIAIASDGRTGWWHNSPHFAVADVSSADPVARVRLHKEGPWQAGSDAGP